MRKIPVCVAFALILPAGGQPLTAAERCVVDLRIDRVYRYGDHPAALVTIEHDCPKPFASVRISCTWLAKTKPVAVGDAIASNVRASVPASVEALSASGRGVAFDSARCRVSRTRR